MSLQTIRRLIRAHGNSLCTLEISADVKETEADEFLHFVGSKKEVGWKAVDRSTGYILAYVLGNRDKAMFKKLYGKLSHLKEAIFYTDFKEAFPKKRHAVGKKYIQIVESENSCICHRIGGFTRKVQ